jgi:hypothetical protein
MTASVLAISLLGVLCATRVELAGRRIGPHTLLSTTFLVAYACFIVLTGGDWMEGGRMISHALPVAAVFVAYASWTLFRSRRRRRIALGTLFALQVLFLFDFAAGQSVGMPLWTSLQQFERYALDYGAAEYSYFDRTNRDHLRNIPTLYEVRRIVDRLLAAGHPTVHVGAHQMGVLPYYLTREYFGRVRFFDANGLTDRVATDARAFSSLPRTPIGVDGTFELFLRRPRWVAADPDFVVPDVIIHQFYEERIPVAEYQVLGYDIVYVQTGEVATGSRLFPGGLIWANQLIAVRRDLLEELGELPKRRLDFRETGAVRAGASW